LLFVSPIDAADVQPGMVIVFLDPLDRSRMVAHRVESQVAGDVPAFRTRGDANLTADPYPVFPDAARGRVRWGVPGLGTVVSVLTSWWGSILLIGAPAGTLIGTELYDYYRRRRATTTGPPPRGPSLTEPSPADPTEAGLGAVAHRPADPGRRTWGLPAVARHRRAGHG
jgi:hypothetical protein